MATTTTTLSLTFTTNSGATRSFSLSAPVDGLTSDAVKTAMDTMVTNGAAFTDALTEAVKAQTTERTVEVLYEADAAE